MELTHYRAMLESRAEYEAIEALSEAFEGEAVRDVEEREKVREAATLAVIRRPAPNS